MGDMRIMLVDDNGDLRRGMRDYLARQEGMKVVAECPSGAEALEALGKVRVDVMVLDLIMPQMDGFEFARQARPLLQDKPTMLVMMLTSSDAPQDRLRAGDMPLIQGFVTKPLTRERVRAMLQPG